MKFLAVVTSPADIYHGFSNWNTLWEDKFAPVNMTSCGRQNITKDREIKNGEKYTILDISSKLDFL